ncbi:MAG: FMN-binding protein [Alphaproteobacteria bacterium]|nr:FMN-binding protein [Alphaproteobacteria bacterium]
MKISQRLGLALGGATAILAPQAQAAGLVLHDGTFDGGTYDAYFGPVQVEITVAGGKVVDSQAKVFPDHRRTSVAINRQALPYLKQEVVQAQSARINIISGATLTSRAYIKSLADALGQAAK